MFKKRNPNKKKLENIYSNYKNETLDSKLDIFNILIRLIKKHYFYVIIIDSYEEFLIKERDKSLKLILDSIK